MTRALTDLSVLDFTTTIAGPHCTRLLADLGAEVIKIESPEGDMMRSRMPLRNGASTSFGQLNAGKKSVVLDMKSAKAVEAAHRLVERADVVVENFRPGVMRRLGLDYAALGRTNRRLVYCAISGYGQTGPSASTYAFGAILAALHQRERTGQGQLVDVSMLESMLTLTLPEMQFAQFEVPPPSKHLFGPVATAEGFISLAVASERTFQGLAAAAGRLDWLIDPRFADYADRRTNRDKLMDEFEAWSKKLGNADCLKALGANGVPAAAYRTVREAINDPQLAHRRAFSEVRDGGGSFRALNPPFRMSGSAAFAGTHAPALGEHTRPVLRTAGFSDAEVDALIECGTPRCQQMR